MTGDAVLVTPPMRPIVISLRRAAERRRLMEARLAEAGIDYEFFDALDAAANEHLPISRYDEAGCIRHFGAPLTASEVACFASHYAVWTLCVERGEPVAILEDDIVMSLRFVEVLGLAATLIGEHRLIRLAGKHNRKFRVLRRLDAGHELVRFLRGPIGTQGYCLSPAGAARLIETADRWIEPVDHHLDGFWKHGLASKAILPFELREIDRRAVAGSIGDRSVRRTGMAKFRREITRQRQAFNRWLYNLRRWPR